jgi:hypothetical protein
MTFLKSSYIITEKQFLIIMTVVSLLIFSSEVKAQEDPPKPVVITPTSQTLNFGVFTYAAVSGTVTVAPSGSRSASGVVLINIGTPTAALFNVVASPGTLISIVNGPDVVLTCICLGTMTLHIGTSDPVSPFVTTKDYPDPTYLYIGGTLTVGNSVSSPPGIYSGSFDLTFSLE